MNVNCVVNRQSPLFKAVQMGNLDLVEFLVANGADVNQRLPILDGGTVLHYSVRNTNLYIVLFLT